MNGDDNNDDDYSMLNDGIDLSCLFPTIITSINDTVHADIDDAFGIGSDVLLFCSFDEISIRKQTKRMDTQQSYVESVL